MTGASPMPEKKVLFKYSEDGKTLTTRGNTYNIRPFSELSLLTCPKYIEEIINDLED